MKPIDFRLRQLECLVTVAETLNFSEAAKILFMTQPTLSTQIKSLEEEVGSALFERSRSHVRLTPAGEVLLVTAKKILAEIEDLSKHLHARPNGLRLKLAADSGAKVYLIPALASKIKSMAPTLKLMLSESTPEALYAQILDGRLDALVGQPTVPHADIVFHQTGIDHLVAAVPAGHRLMVKTELSMRDLAQETILVTAAHECRQHRGYLQDIFKPFDIHPTLLEVSSSCMSHLAMVAAGMGIALVPHAVEQISFPFVSFMPITDQLPAVQIGVSHRRSSVSISLDILMRALREVQPDFKRPKSRTGSKDLPSCERSPSL